MHASAASPPLDWVLHEQSVELDFSSEDLSKPVKGSATYFFFVRVGAKEPVLRLNATQLRITSVAVQGKKTPYSYDNWLGSIVASSPDDQPKVTSSVTNPWGLCFCT